ncbi:MAG: asparagine synthase (glutamine-hydrolyzing) [Roseiflexus sp.]
MCGIVGIVNVQGDHPITEEMLRQMLALIRHRGPDQFGIYLDDRAGLGSARLSIIDLSGGQQPIASEDEGLWIVFNGEIFNYVELRPDLEARGRRFTTNTDTEVILHLYEEYGPACLSHLNGQFAIAIWDAREQTLFLARDRVGILPLFYTIVDGTLIFASEIKAIIADPRVQRAIDPVALEQIFTFWGTLSPRTIFRGIVDLPPGHYLIARRGRIDVQPYWRLEFGAPTEERREEEYVEELRDLLIDATTIRLRADVPVGAYLSGGLDSSTVAAIVRQYADNRLDTFSIAFSDPEFDESRFQRQMAQCLGTNHQVAYVTHADIGRVFPEVIWHTEMPILRTSPAPLFILSQLVRDHSYRVVLTGEGADEFLAGYDIFKEAKVRRFWARQPSSRLRPLLLRRLYPWIAGFASKNVAYLAAFFSEGLMDTTAPDYSHRPRWRTTSRTRRFFSDDVRQAADTLAQPTDRAPYYPEAFSSWDPLQQAQYLEITTFLSQYLLSAQGDRMIMAHAVEGRFPFLDHRVIELANRLPPRLKLRGLTEKYILRRVGRAWLPDVIWQRPKQPYRAPIHRSFFHDARLDYVQHLLSPDQVQANGLFKPTAVAHLKEKAQSGVRLSETEDMALVGILSTQLLVERFIHEFRLPPPISEADNVRVCIRNGITVGGTYGI